MPYHEGRDGVVESLFGHSKLKLTKGLCHGIAYVYLDDLRASDALKISIRRKLCEIEDLVMTEIHAKRAKYLRDSEEWLEEFNRIVGPK